MIYLASQSPRRAELLAQIGVPFEQFSVDIDETPQVGEAPNDLVARLALQKAQAGWQRVNANNAPHGREEFAHDRENHADKLKIAPVLGSDTIVVCQGQIMGKPRDKADGLAMLRQLSAYPHSVMTAVALVGKDFEHCITQTSQVQFRQLNDDELERYWNTGEPADKAGGYGIQGAAAVFIEKLEGSYSAVMGLPLYETAQLLRQAGVEYWNYE